MRAVAALDSPTRPQPDSATSTSRDRATPPTRRRADGLVEKDDYRDEKAEIDEALAVAESNERLAKSEGRKLGTGYQKIFTTLADLWDDATPPQRNELLSKVISRIEVVPGGWKNPDKAKIVPRWSDE